MKENSEPQQALPLSRFDKFILFVFFTALIIIFLLLSGWSNGSFLSARTFDSQVWKESNNNWIDWQPSKRKSMLNDLVDNQRLNDLSVSQVKQLLGDGRLSKTNNGARITYFLGPLSFNLGADDRLYLCVEFESGEVSRVHTFEGI